MNTLEVDLAVIKAKVIQGCEWMCQVKKRTEVRTLRNTVFKGLAQRRASEGDEVPCLHPHPYFPQEKDYIPLIQGSLLCCHTGFQPFVLLQVLLSQKLPSPQNFPPLLSISLQTCESSPCINKWGLSWTMLLLAVALSHSLSKFLKEQSNFILPASISHSLVVVQLLSCVWLFATPWSAARQASLSFTISRSLLKLMSIESVIPSNHRILSLLLLPSIIPTIKVFSNELALHIRCPKYWSFSFSSSPSNEYSGLISFRIDWFDFLAVQGTLERLLQCHN